MPRRIITLLMLVAMAALARSQTLQGYEYWLDADYASRQSASTTQPDISLQISTAQLVQGVHYLNFHAQAPDGEWGPLTRHLFFVPESMGQAASVVAMEYWIDSDAASRQTVEVSSDAVSHAVDVSQMVQGVHFLTIRLQNNDGEWSAPSRHIFYVPEAMGTIEVTKLEYWIDDDRQNNHTVNVSAGTVSEQIDVSQLAEGIHYLSVRLQSSDGTWSNPSRHIFFNPGEDYAVNSPIVAYQYTLNGETQTVSIPEQTEYALGTTFDLPDPLLTASPMGDACQYAFTATEATLTRRTPVSFSIHFQNKTGIWSNTVGEELELTDVVRHAFVALPMRQSVSLPQAATGDFHALSLPLPKSQKYFLSADAACRLVLYKADGTRLATVSSEEMVQTYSIELSAGTYYAIVYDMANEGETTVSLMDNQVPTPVISYAKPTVTISCGKAGADIFYTLDGTIPNSQSTKYTGPFAADQNCTVKAIATYSGMDNSEVASHIVDDFKVETPGIEFANLHVYITCATARAAIRYTLDGSDPLQGGLAYTEPIAITGNCTVKAVATRENWHTSDVASQSIDVTNLTTATPQIERQGDLLIVTSLTEGARFHYTTDGTTPTAQSAQTDRVIRPEHNCLVRVVAMKDGELPSAVVDVTVDWMQAETPSFSYDEAASVLTISCATPGATIHYTTDGTVPTRSASVYTQPLHINGNLTVSAIAVAEGFNDSEVNTHNTSGFTCALPAIRLEGETLVMTCAKPEDATIYYTLDGSSPDTNGAAYTGPVPVDEPCLVRAIAKRQDYNSSAVAQFQLLRTATPDFKRNGSNVVVTSATEGAAIHYTTDGTMPTAQSKLVPADGVVALAHNLTLKAIALKDQELASTLGELAVDWFQAETPSFSYDEAASVLTISCATPGATIHYELGGDAEPTRASSVYTGPLTLTDNRPVRAMAVAEGFNDSEVGLYRPDAFTCDRPELAYDGRHLTMSTRTAGATIRYTTDGTTPGTGSAEYTGELTIGELMTVCAIAMKENINDSPVATLPVEYYYDGEQAETAREGVLSQAFAWSGTSGIGRLTLKGHYGDADLQWVAQSLGALQHLDMSQAHMTDNRLTAETFKGLQVLTLSVPASVTQAANGLFDGCPRLAALTWSPSFRLTDAMLGTLADNPNLLLYARTRGYAPASLTNVIVDGHADRIVLGDRTDGGNANFHCPEAFVADHIAYTHHYAQQTGLGECRGWETLCLPFTVQTVSHPTQGAAAPFAASRQNDERPFWLSRLGGAGFESTATIEANTPYIIAMPNHPTYADEYLLCGNVAFEARNATVEASDQLTIDTRGTMALVPCLATTEKQEGMLVLNVGQPFEGYAEGSAFLADLETPVRPFQAYAGEQNAAVRAIAIDGGQTGIQELTATAPQHAPVYDLQGRRQSSRRVLGKGVYIVGGRQVLVR